VELNAFVKKYFDTIVRVLAAIALSALMAAFILAFNSGKLPYSEHGDAFDTVYAYEESSEN
jgi:hypothetical protein